ncbi:hypothetical protein OE88DRAFT_1740040 [Heliocybe sulcata]|uniref:Uncharacterized protein n=1 Tax=Heliocybe sulcata TaxID=5364 RepID=A0A5C3MLL2_9AGAM|nr:hypothetical protein OE88DRAFT_1740040 [Heliocybe sulcata]
MPARALPLIDPYIQAPPPRNIPTCPGHILDLNKSATAKGRTELAAIVRRDTMKTLDFIATIPLDALKNNEKQMYAGDIKATGSYQGYKLRKYRIHLLLIIVEYDTHDYLLCLFCKVKLYRHSRSPDTVICEEELGIDYELISVDLKRRP